MNEILIYIFESKVNILSETYRFRCCFAENLDVHWIVYTHLSYSDIKLLKCQTVMVVNTLDEWSLSIEVLFSAPYKNNMKSNDVEA